MIVCGHLFPIEGKAYYGPHIIGGVMHRSLGHEFVEALVLSVEIIGSLIESIHVFLAF